jgi:hypothetical protein
MVVNDYVGSLNDENVLNQSESTPNLPDVEMIDFTTLQDLTF